MSEMNNTENKNVQHINTEAYLAERAIWMADAVELISGSRETDPLSVFEPATEVRDDSTGMQLTDEQEVALREVAGRFGIGGEADVKSGATHQILEGGKPWKVEAEAKITEAAETILFAGSPNRKLGQDEVDYLKTKLPEGEEPASTEYEMVRQIAEMQEGFEPLESDEELPFGYDINSNYAVLGEPTGQLVRIGSLNGADVVLFRVDRENYVDENEEDPKKQNKYRNQPDSAALMGVVSEVLNLCGDDHSSVGINSSTTYASRAVDTVRAGLKNGREFKVGMYGRQTLADVKGDPIAAPTGINQIPGELHTMQTKLAQLASEFNQNS